MSQTVSLVLTPQTRDALHRVVDDRTRPLAHILRARIVLLSDERLSVLEVARQAGVGRSTVWRWQQRFAEEGLAWPNKVGIGAARRAFAKVRKSGKVGFVTLITALERYKRCKPVERA